MMGQENRTAVYDRALGVEAYCLSGIVQPFPSHFHEYYVIGLMEGGRRRLCCRGREYDLGRGEVVLFEPGDVHACAQIGDHPLDYRGINIPRGVMRALTTEPGDAQKLPRFSQTVIRDREVAAVLAPLHRLLMDGGGEFEKEERLLLTLDLLLHKYAQPSERAAECRREVEQACAFMERHCAEHIGLEQIGRAAGLSKSTLLRAFTREKGVTPYLYLQNIRIREAKKLLRRGVPPVEAALRTGFADQSHFTRDFSRFIGLSPGTYRRMFAPGQEAAENTECTPAALCPKGEWPQCRQEETDGNTE